VGVLLLFVDGVGLGESDPGKNPLFRARLTRLRLAEGLPSPDPAAILVPTDACLGVPGLPQSATGQTSLFTGVHVAALQGEHVTAHPTARLREVITEHSLLKRAVGAGKRAYFANAHSERFWQMIREGKRRLAASTLTAMAAGLEIPTLEDLAQGRAVLWDITHEIASAHMGYQVPLLEAAEAGKRLAHLATEFDLLLFESFLPDLAGHRRIESAAVLMLLDDFLGGLLAHRSPQTTLVLCSDHGNVEDATTKMHTANPVPLLAVGPGAGHFRQATAITDVAPAILALLSEGHRGGTS